MRSALANPHVYTCGTDADRTQGTAVAHLATVSVLAVGAELQWKSNLQNILSET